MLSDWELLGQWVGGKDQRAFGELVRRHVDWVYRAARRMLGGPGREAEDVTQAVFLLLSQQGGQIRRTGALSGWLYRATGYCCANVRKEEGRRKRREREAAMVRPEVEAGLTGVWGGEVQAVLDEALGRLAEKERQAIVVRYLEGKTTCEAGQLLGISAAAVEKRLQRGVRKLRGLFARKGFVVPAAGVVAVMVVESAQAAPTGLAENVVGVTSDANASAVRIAKGAMAIRRMAMLKMAAVVAVALVSVVWAGVVIAERGEKPTTEPSAELIKPYTGTLKDGVSVEVLGVVQGHVIQTWWLPDGTPDIHPILAKSRWERSRHVGEAVELDQDDTIQRRLFETSGNAAKAKYTGVGLVVRFGLKTRDGSEASEMTDRWYTTALDSQGKVIDGVYVLYGMGVENATGVMNPRFSFATGPWLPTGVRAAAQELGVKKGEVYLSKAEPLRGGTYVGLRGPKARWDHVLGEGYKRLCGRNSNGDVLVAIPFQPVQLGMRGGSYEQGFHFADVEPADLKEFWVERRTANEWIEFRNVAAEPGVKTELQFVTSDSELKK